MIQGDVVETVRILLRVAAGGASRASEELVRSCKSTDRRDENADKRSNEEKAGARDQEVLDDFLGGQIYLKSDQHAYASNIRWT